MCVHYLIKSLPIIAVIWIFHMEWRRRDINRKKKAKKKAFNDIIQMVDGYHSKNLSKEKIQSYTERHHPQVCKYLISYKISEEMTSRNIV